MLYEKEIASILESNLANIDLKQVEEGGKFKVVATNETKDRDGDIITLDGWDIENYRKNPVILANHDYKIENIIWKMVDIYEESGNIVVEGVFSKSNPLGILAERLYNEGMLKTVSVWFIWKERDGEKITRKELLELSFVAVPCNPNAVSLDGKDFEDAVAKGLIEEVSEGEKEVTLEDLKNDVSELKSVISSFTQSLDEVKWLIKTLADDKAEEKASEQARKQAQKLVNVVSDYLRDTKKSK